MKKVFLMAPNYQAGRDSIAGFKRYYKGEIVDEVYVPLGQLDYSAELAKIAAAVTWTQSMCSCQAAWASISSSNFVRPV